MHGKSVYVLRAHILSDTLFELFNKLQHELGEDNVFILYDETRTAWDTSKAPSSVIVNNDSNAIVLIINDVLCLELNSMHDVGYGGTQNVSWSFWHPETAISIMHAWLRQKNQEFKYIWFIEYDVECNGDFAIPLKECDAINADLMAKGQNDGFDIRDSAVDPGWCWWCRLDGEIAATPDNARHGIFFPMVRVSDAMVDVIRNNFGKSTGFCEVYSKLICEAMPADVFGCFVYRPTITRYEMEHMSAHPNNLLYHPVR